MKYKVGDVLEMNGDHERMWREGAHAVVVTVDPDDPELSYYVEIDDAIRYWVAEDELRGESNP